MMKTRKVAWLIPVAGLIAFAGSNGAEPTDQPDQAPQVQPYSAEATVSAEPIRVLVEDVEAMLERLGVRQPDAVAPAAGDETDRAQREGSTRVIEIETPPIVNRSPYFQFRDATSRATPTQQLSDETRRLVVERYRNSLLKRKQRVASK